MTKRADDRSPIAIAYNWAYRIIGVSIEMVLPGLLGYWLLDLHLGTRCLFLLLGLAAGMILAVWHLIRMTSGLPGESEESEDR